MILAIKGSDQNPVLMNVRTMEKESYSWSGCVEALRRLCPYTVEPKQAYEQYYGVPFPEETPDQKPEKKPEPPRKKETPSKSQKSEKPPVAPVQQKPEKEPEAPPTEPAPPEIPQERRWNWRNTRELSRKTVLYATMGRKCCSPGKHSGQKGSVWRMNWPSGCVQGQFPMQAGGGDGTATGRDYKADCQ
mgnify:CR=1 FL=1